ncbi:MAG: hypothetical protein AB9842_01340 [Bacteroidales bacterium]
MLIRLFRTESLLQFILLLFLGVLLWMPAFINPVPSPIPWSPVPVYEKIIGLIGTVGLLNTILAFILVLAQGIILTLLLSAHDLSPRNNLLPAIIYMILMSWNPLMLTLNPALITNAILLIFLFLFMKVYERPDAFKEVFSACFTLSLACFFDAPLIILLLLVWFGFLIYRVFTWREWMISLIGFGLPLIYICFYYFWKGELSGLLNRTTTVINQIEPIDYYFDPVTYIILIIMGLLVLSAILRIYSIIQEKVISIRKKFLFIIWFFMLTIPVFLFSGNTMWYQGSISLLPATALISFHFASLKKLFWWEILFTTLLLGLFWIRIF